MSTLGTYLIIGGSSWYTLLQVTFQLAFFMAQWEEYHTHVLPHCAGKWCGVTESNYFLGMLAIVNSFLDREAIYNQTMEDVLAPLGDSILIHVPDAVKTLELRHFLVFAGAVFGAVLMVLSVRRVMLHPRITGAPSAGLVWKRRFDALSKLSSPFALSIAALLIPPEAIRHRYLSVTFGLAFSLLTKKMIVFSMAKMAFAAVQWDALPLLLAAIWIRLDDRLTKMGADFVLGVLCLWYAYRLLSWVNVTINQICEKLGIFCFRLKKKKSD